MFAIKKLTAGLVVWVMGWGLMFAQATTNPPTDLKILSRAEWAAKPPVSEMKTNVPAHITIHHTGVVQKPDRTLAEKLKALQNFSQNPGKLANGKTKPKWPDVPYHYYIDCKGEMGEGRDVNAVGDTNTEYDPSGHVLIVLEGNFETEQPTDAQIVTMKKAVIWLAQRFHIPPDEIGSHKDYAQTLCPGKNLEKHIAPLRKLLDVNKPK